MFDPHKKVLLYKYKSVEGWKHGEQGVALKKFTAQGKTSSTPLIARSGYTQET